jgi:hypothetical protein
MASSTRQTKDFFIQGPTIARGSNVAQAIGALYYLPKRYKLVLSTTAGDSTFYEEINRLVKRMALSARVRFSEVDDPDAIIVSEATPTDLRDQRLLIGGDSPEALASAILRVGRVTL